MNLETLQVANEFNPANLIDQDKYRLGTIVISNFDSNS